MAPKDTIVSMRRDEHRPASAETAPVPDVAPPQGPRDSVSKPEPPKRAERMPVPKEAAPLCPVPQAPPMPGVDVAPAARLKRRHWGQVTSFVALVLLPLMAIAMYLFTVAEDQYASVTGFTVQREEGSTPGHFLGISPALMGGQTASDTDVLYAFIQSQDMVERIDALIDLRAHYSRHWTGPVFSSDKAFSLWPGATIEDLVWYWSRIVRVSYDQATGLIEVRVTAFDPDYATELARLIVDESQSMINALSRAARDDTMRYATDDLEEALRRLKEAREALTLYRTKTQIVDPLADLQTRLGVMDNLQQQLAQALISYDLLLETTTETDPRVERADRRISAIRERISSERDTFASDESPHGAVGGDYPTLIAEFERLSVDLEFAEQAYRAALTAVDVARENAIRQNRYLATYIDPTRAESADYPKRTMLLGLAGLFLVLAWSILVLIYYAVRDRR